MTTINELKEVILEMEKAAYDNERQAREAEPWEDTGFYEKVAGMYRIAAACCWEKLERLEAGDGDCHCKRIACGLGHPHRKLSDRQLLANDPAGWVVDEWSEWENPTVHCWQPTPEASEEVKKKIQEIWAKTAAGEQV